MPYPGALHPLGKFLVMIVLGIVGYDVYLGGLGMPCQCCLVEFERGLGVHPGAVKGDDVGYVVGVEKSVEVYPVTAAHRGLLHAFAFLNPSVGGAAVVRGMYAVGIVNHGGTVHVHKRLGQLIDELFLLLCVGLARHFRRLLVGETDAVEQVYRPLRGVRHAESTLYPLGNTFGIGVYLTAEFCA